MKTRKTLRKAMALLLVTVNLLSSFPTYAFAQDEGDTASAEQEVYLEEAEPQVSVPEAAEADFSQTGGAGEQNAAPQTPAAPEIAESSGATETSPSGGEGTQNAGGLPGETPAPEESDDISDPAQPEPGEEEPADDEGSELSDTAEEDIDAEEKEEEEETPEEEEEEEVKYPEFCQSGGIGFGDGWLSVTLSAPEGVYPEGASLRVSSVSDAGRISYYEYLADLNCGSSRQPLARYFMDICVADAYGAEIPNTSGLDLRLSFSFSRTLRDFAEQSGAEEASVGYRVYHYFDDGAGVSAANAGAYGSDLSYIELYTSSLSPWLLEVSAANPGGPLMLAAAAPHTHVWDAGNITTAPTCSTDGIKTFTCTVSGCTDTKTEAVPADHTGPFSYSPAPTCTASGSALCGGCGQSVALPATGHKLGSWVTLRYPTCTDDGLERRECSDCSYFETSTLTKTGHSLKLDSEQKPDCLTDGYTHIVCTNTDNNTGASCIYEENNTVDALGHDYQKTGSSAPTCTLSGYNTYTCSRCGLSAKGDIIPALGHDHSVEVTKPDCINTGVNKCVRCPDTVTVPVAAGQHSWDGGTVTTPETCAADGMKTFTCTVTGCGAQKTDTIPAAHLWESAAYDHTDPDCVNAGYDKYKCTRCTDINTVTLPATGVHDYDKQYDTATCTSDGILVSKCKTCGDETKKVSPAAGHSFNAWHDTVAADCEKAGQRQRECQNTHDVLGEDGGISHNMPCTEVETEVIEPLGHDRNAGNGYYCSRCNTTFPQLQTMLDTLNTLPPLGGVDASNAQQVINAIKAIRAAEADIDNGTDADLKAALDAVVRNSTTRYPELVQLELETNSFRNYTTYETIGEAPLQSYTVFWNDNADNQYRAGWETPATIGSFLDDATVSLSYTVKDSNGSVVRTGALSDPAAANKEFDFLGANVTSLLNVSYDSGKYTITTDSQLPRAYKSSYTDVKTGEVFTETFTVEYGITMKNPDTAHYMVTSPSGASDSSISIPAGGSTILTVYNDFNAKIHWLDDHNRPDGSGSTPRPAADVIKANSTVYVYPEGYNVPSGTPVTGYYELNVTQIGTTDYYNVSLGKLPAYDNDGNPLCYYIAQNGSIPAANAGTVPGNRYDFSYTNNDNYASKTNGLYDGGELTETLSNTVKFSVNKVWVDDKDDNPSSRPNATVSIWSSLVEYDAGGNPGVDISAAFPVPKTSTTYPVPKSGGQMTVYRTLDGGVISDYLPMYDEEGRKYVYFGKESSISGYTTTISYDPNEAKSIVDAVDGGGYLLAGATVTNTADNVVKPELTKTFTALSLQNKVDPANPITATFMLQYKDADGNWVPATVDNILGTVPQGVTADSSGVYVELNGFAAENGLMDSFDKLTVNRFITVPNGSGGTKNLATEYRYVEVGASVNGVSASYSPSGWISDGKGGLIYNGSIILDNGQTSTVLNDAANKTSGPKDTTAIFSASAENDSFTNKLEGKSLIELRKTWLDANGKNISADPSVASNQVQFQIYRDDVPFKTVTLTAADLVNGVSGDFWDKLLQYDRYDDSGREYRFKVSELSSFTGFDSVENYKSGVVEYPVGSGILVPKLECDCTNSQGTGTSLRFDVEKLWLDDSDQETRNPVMAAIYRFRDVDGTLLPAPELVTDGIRLDNSNNWYRSYSFACKPGDSVNNYIVVEDGIVANGSLVRLNNGSAYTSAYFDSVKPVGQSGYGRIELGTVGSATAQGAAWDGLCYIYRAFSEETDNSSSRAVTRLTNLRTGEQRFDFTKNWTSGSVIRKARFAICDKNDTVLADFVIDIAADAQGNPTGIKEPISVNNYAGLSFSVEAKSLDVNSSGNYSSSVLIKGLNKFDAGGAQLEYHLRELFITGDDGTEYPVVNGSCTMPGNVNYSVSYNNTVTYSGNDQHRSPDNNVTVVDNSLSGSYRLVANKLWRDYNPATRPDISFTVYRVSAAESAAIADAVARGDASALASAVEGYADKSHMFISDKFWDTKMNDYWWTCSIGTVARYDADGFPYVYFATERLNSSNTLAYHYSKYYCNVTSAYGSDYRPNNPGGTYTSEDVFAMPQSALSGNVILLADGVNSGNGGLENYYSATVVNRIEGTRTVSGRKLWRMPFGMTASPDQLPGVGVELYRMTKEISVNSYSSSSAYAADIRALGEKIDLSSNVISWKTVDGGTQFRYVFDKDVKNNLLPSYNEYGMPYYYYTLEKTDPSNHIQNFPESSIQYSDNDFTINNVFVSEKPFVEVSVQKQWQVSDKVLADLKKYGFTTLEPSQLAPAVINLNGAPLDDKDSELPGMKRTFNSVTLDPANAAALSVGQSVTVNGVTYTLTRAGTKNVVTADYTFVDYYNDVTGNTEKLPYYWITDRRIKYSLDEKIVNGYSVTTAGSVDDVAFTGPVNEVYTTDVSKLPTITNTYEDNEKTQYKKINFYKYWGDNYVNNDAYRPDKLELVINRRIGSTVDNNWSQTVEILKTDFAGKYVWYKEVDDLLKYSPAGEEYDYFIKSETAYKLGSGGSYISIAAAENPGDRIDPYSLTAKNPTSLSNALTSSTSLSASKEWKIDGVTVMEYTNAAGTGLLDLWNMGAIPVSIKYVVERKLTTEGADKWTTIPASNYTDAVHKTTLNGADIIGREVVLGDSSGKPNFDSNNYQNLLNMVVKWTNLPESPALDPNSKYEYRVTEVLIWADGSTTLSSGSWKGISGSASTTQNTDGSFTTKLTNTIHNNKVRIAKLWDDNNGSENTRPASINVTIVPVDAVSGNPTSAGHTFTITSNGNSTANPNCSIYYSDWFALPKNVALTFGDENASGVNYRITESWTMKNGAVYTKTIGGTATDNGDGTYTFNISNKYDPTNRKTVDFKLSKNWKGDEELWKDIVRPALKFKLQILNPDTKKWEDVTNDGDTSKRTDLSNFTADLTTPLVQTLSYDASGKPVDLYWNSMYKYWYKVSVDGKAEQIQYRAVEIVDNGSGKMSYKADADSKSWSFSDSTSKPVSISFNNTYQYNTLTLSKSWTMTDNSGAKTQMSNADLQKLVNLGYIPSELRFAVEYKLAGDTSGTWKHVPAAAVSTAGKVAADAQNGYVILYTSALGTAGASGLATGMKLPVWDADGQLISYRVREVGVKYKGQSGFTALNWNAGTGSLGNITTNLKDVTLITPITGESAAVTVGMTNDYAYVSKEIEKVWRDENNRDGKRGDFLFTLYRDGAAFSTNNVSTGAAAALANAFCTVTKDDSNNRWTIKWDYLPRYKDSDSSTQSVYTWVESSPTSGYRPLWILDNGVYKKWDDTLSDYAAAAYNPNSDDEINAYEPERGAIEVTKNWNDDNNAFNSQPDEIWVKLTYLENGTNYKDVTLITDADFETVNGKKLHKNDSGEPYAVLNGSYTVSNGWVRLEKNGSSWTKAAWRDVPVYTSTGTKISYRVIEGVKNSAGTVTPISPNTVVNNYKVSYKDVNVNASAGTATATGITNDLDTGPLTISKNWGDANDKYGLIRPDSLTFRVEYRIDGGAWTKLPAVCGVDSSGNITVDASTGWQATLTGLPRQSGKNYEYRTSEVCATFTVGGKSVTVNAVNSGTNGFNGATWIGSLGAYSAQVYTANLTVRTASAENKAQLGSIKASKLWHDDSDRECLRPSAVTFELYKVKAGAETADVLVDTAVVGSGDNWEKLWTDLPLKNYDGTSAYYYVVETAVNGYTTSYNGKTAPADAKLAPSAGASGAEIKVDNTHITEKGTVEALKVWDDKDNFYNTRPTSLNFELLWSVTPSNRSSFVSVPTAGTVYSLKAGDVCTSSVNPCSAAVNTLVPSAVTKAAWNDLPVWVSVNGVKTRVYYMVVETPVYGYANPVYTVNGQNTDILPVQNSTTGTVEVTNSLERTQITINKSWVGDGAYSDIFRPVKLSYKVEYTADPNTPPMPFNSADGTACVNGIAVVTANSDGTWPSIVLTDVPRYDNLNRPYIYIVSEYSAQYSDGSVKYASGSTAFNGSSAVWTGTLGEYEAVTSCTPDSSGKSWTAKSVNTCVTGELKLGKIWNDSSNRDQSRTKIRLQLYRDGKPFGKPVDLDGSYTANRWSTSWTGLPVYKDYSKNIKSEYYVEETAVNGYIATYSLGTVSGSKASDIVTELDKTVPAELTVTNTHIQKLFDLSGEKKWADNNDRYGMRPASVDLTLWWTSDDPSDPKAVWSSNITVVNTVPDPDTDSGDYVFTTSPLKQTLSATTQNGSSTWTGAKWENLPACILVDDGTGKKESKAVYYRIEEGPLSGGYSSSGVSDKPGSYSGSHSVSIENTLQVTELTVTKAWSLPVALLRQMQVLPSAIGVKLQYSDDGGATWLDVPANGSAQLTPDTGGVFTYTFAGLSKAYDYRAVETSLVYPGGQITARLSANGTSGTVGSFVFDCVTSGSAATGFGTLITNSIINTQLIIEKQWTGDSDDTSRRKPVTVRLYRDLEDGTDKDSCCISEVELSDANGWTYTWNDLPMYKNCFSSGGTLKRSVYTVEELPVKGYAAKYSDNDLSFPDSGVMSATIVNRRDKIVHTGDDTLINTYAALMSFAFFGMLGSGVLLSRKRRED